jgi:hypothetical protein
VNGKNKISNIRGSFKKVYIVLIAYKLPNYISSITLLVYLSTLGERAVPGGNFMKQHVLFLHRIQVQEAILDYQAYSSF